MKKVVLGVIANLVCWVCLAQDGFKFQVKVVPNTTYTTEMETFTDGTIDILAEEAVLEQMKASGVETPMKMQQEMRMTMVSQTENEDVEGTIPAKMHYEK